METREKLSADGFKLTIDATGKVVSLDQTSGAEEDTFVDEGEAEITV
ncbi:MAG: hypothetical protein AB1497_12395 [Bacillota bacterium]